jgi:hypothetical protein
MKRIARKEEKEVWLDVPARPYRVAAPVEGKNFVCALFVADPSISDAERMDLSRQVVATGCRYAVCAGLNCSEWDSSIDLAYLETYAELDPPDATFVMTTWHKDESVADVLEFALMNTDFDDNRFAHVLVLVLGEDPRLQSEIAAALAG